MPLANSFPGVGGLREIVMFMIAAVLWVLIVAFVPRVWGSRDEGGDGGNSTGRPGT